MERLFYEIYEPTKAAQAVDHWAKYQDHAASMWTKLFTKYQVPEDERCQHFPGYTSARSHVERMRTFYEIYVPAAVHLADTSALRPDHATRWNELFTIYQVPEDECRLHYPEYTSSPSLSEQAATKVVMAVAAAPALSPVERLRTFYEIYEPSKAAQAPDLWAKY